MIEILSYPSEMSKMSHFTDADWATSISASDSPSSLSQLPSSYAFTDSSYLTPMSFVTDPTALSISHTPPPPDFSRPRSSSGIFSSRPEDFGYGSGLKISGVEDISFPNSPFVTEDSPLPASTPAFTARSSIDYSPGLSNALTPRPLARTPSARSHVAIAPNPAGMAKLRANPYKRGREEDTPPESSSKRRRRSTTPIPSSIELNEEERLLLKLKDEECLAWKEIASRFYTQLGKQNQVPALQMRYKRLREKIRVWTDKDVNALIEAREWWEKQKWDIIANRMLDLGVEERWPAKYCLRKWELMHPELDLSRERVEPLATNMLAPFSDRGTPDLVETPRHY